MIAGMSDDQPRLDTGHLDMSSHDQTPDMSLDTSLSIREAATRADVTEKTVRRWIKGGRLHALKLGGQYRITLADLDRARDTPSEGHVHPAGTHDLDSGHTSPRVDMSEGLDTGQGEGRHASDPVDLAPLTDLIDDLTRRNADLAAAAAMWQTRAAHLENELKQLTAGNVVPENAPEPNTVAAEGPQVLQERDPAPTGVLAWWKRLWGA